MYLLSINYKVGNKAEEALAVLTDAYLSKTLMKKALKKEKLLREERDVIAEGELHHQINYIAEYADDLTLDDSGGKPGGDS